MKFPWSKSKNNQNHIPTKEHGDEHSDEYKERMRKVLQSHMANLEANLEQERRIKSTKLTYEDMLFDEPIAPGTIQAAKIQAGSIAPSHFSSPDPIQTPTKDKILSMISVEQAIKFAQSIKDQQEKEKLGDPLALSQEMESLRQIVVRIRDNQCHRHDRKDQIVKLINALFAPIEQKEKEDDVRFDQTDIQGPDVGSW